MYTYDNFHKVKEEIENSRNKARAEADARSLALAEISPEISSIDAELRGTGMLLFKTACSGGDIEPIKRRNTELMKRRREVILKLGYPEDYTEPKYSCSVCSDTGFIEGVKVCKCFKERLFTLNIASSGMGKLIERQSFESFNLDFYKYSDEVYGKMTAVVEAAKKYAKGFSKKGGNLLLLGNTGTGKTHISTSIAKEIIAEGHSVLYDSTQNVITVFENERFKSGYGQTESKTEKFLECDLLILDDLGTEITTQFTLSCIYNLINTRQNRGLSTIISTNLSPEELAEKYDGRIYSRLLGRDFSPLLFCGKDYRIFG